jgi:hypothetical protein
MSAPFRKDSGAQGTVSATHASGKALNSVLHRNPCLLCHHTGGYSAGGTVSNIPDSDVIAIIGHDISIHDGLQSPAAQATGKAKRQRRIIQGRAGQVFYIVLPLRKRQAAQGNRPATATDKG